MSTYLDVHLFGCPLFWQVLLLKTIDPPAGLVNGARGVVVQMVGSCQHPMCRFLNGVERIIRPESFQLTQAGRVVASRVQLPLALGWSISVHKSQGMSLDRVEMSLRHVFECGQIYVALSRARSLEGLALRDVDWSKLRAHPRVLAWHERAMSDAHRAGEVWRARPAPSPRPAASAEEHDHESLRGLNE